MTNNVVRSGIIVFISSVIFLYLFFVLWQVQVKHHGEYFAERERQNHFNNEEAKRGTIYATRKDGQLIPLAEDLVYYKLVISPKDIREDYENRLYTLLNAITPIDRGIYDKKIANKGDGYEELKIVTKEETNKIESADLSGVITFQTYKRNYPMKEIGGRILGFVGGGEEGFVGRYGLEKEYENDLKESVGANSTFFSQIFKSPDDQNGTDKKFSKDIVTSLEPNVMTFLDNALTEMKATWEPDEASAIVMNVKTGEIIAMDTIPEFDPNDYQNFDVKLFSNPSVQGVYELGSIMKPVTMSGGLEEKLVTPQSTYDDKGFVKIDNYTIKNFDERTRGVQTMQDVISKSLNTGAVYVQQLLGKEKFKYYFNKFGLNDTTDIDFPGEVINKTTNLDTDTDVNFATAAFGQGVAVTPISMLNALSTIANDGQTVCPHFLVTKILQDDSKINYECERDISTVVSSTTAKTMNSMMVELIDTGLAHGRYKDANYKVGAKTGTAQLPSPDGKYYKDKFIHSYFTYFPASDPKFAVLIYQINPKKGLLASITLAPVGSKFKNFLLTYFNVPPDRK